MPNTVIQLKKSSTPGSIPLPANLANGELAINFADGKLFYKDTAGQIAEISGGGGPGGNYFGTVNANSVLIVADTTGDILTIEAGSGISIIGDAVNDKLTISTPAGDGANAFASATIAGANAAVGTGANAYAAIVGTSANAFTSATIAGANTAVGTGANAYAAVVGTSANAFTSATIAGANTAVGAGANSYANLVWSRSNTYADTVGVSANAFMIAVQNGSNTAIGTGANAFTSATIAGANTAVGAGANAFASVVGTSANAFTSATIAGANTAVGTGANAFTSATIAGANTAVGQGANAYANLVWSRSNTRSDAIGVSANAFTSATIAGANAAVGLGANTYANSTFIKLSATSQTITGNVNIVGDLTLSGNTFVIDATRLEVDDPLIYLAANNYTSDIVDIGFIGNYVNATGANVHTGLYREHEDKMYYLFQGYDREPINNHLGALSNNMTLAVLNADLRTSNLVLGGANAILTIGAAFNKANAALPNTSGVSFNGNLNFPTGNVGIGTATPSSCLEVLGDVPNSLSNLGTGDAATITITNANVGGLNRIAKTLYEIGNLPIASIAGAYTVFNAGGNIGGDLIFSTQRHVGTGVQERMRIDANGNVGIGTTSPLLKLDVSGSSIQGIRVISTDTSGSNIAYFTAQHGSGSSLQLRAGTGYTYLLSTSAVPLYVGTNSAIHMTFDASGNVGIGTTSTNYKLEVAGSFAAQTKSFVINHPSKPGMMLRYGSLEGPENGVYVRGRLDGKSIIELPDYWWNLIDESTITVNLTPIGRSQDIWVQSTSAYFIHLNQPADCFFTVFAERKDVDKLVVEY